MPLPSESVADVDPVSDVTCPSLPWSSLLAFCMDFSTKISDWYCVTKVLAVQYCNGQIPLLRPGLRPGLGKKSQTVLQ